VVQAAVISMIFGWIFRIAVGTFKFSASHSEPQNGGGRPVSHDMSVGKCTSGLTVLKSENGKNHYFNQSHLCIRHSGHICVLKLWSTEWLPMRCDEDLRANIT
jgi:hypothetical protein